MRARLKGEKRLKVRLLSGLIKLRRTSQKSISNLQGAKVLVVSDIGEDQCNMRVGAKNLRRRGVQKGIMKLGEISPSHLDLL